MGKPPRLCAASFRNAESCLFLNSAANSRSSLQYTQVGSEQYGEPTRGSRLSASGIHHQRESKQMWAKQYRFQSSLYVIRVTLPALNIIHRLGEFERSRNSGVFANRIDGLQSQGD